MNEALRIVIVAEHASFRFGGEAALPLHYFRVMRRRGVAVWLVVHARTRNELSELFPDDPHIRYVEDTFFHRLTDRLGAWLPARIESFTTGYARRLAGQCTGKRLVRTLIDEFQIDVVHQPMPVSPREPSMMFGLGVPVIIGPMNGNIGFPPAFRSYQGHAVSAVLGLGRLASRLLNRLIPGKLLSAALLVANDRTKNALPPQVHDRVIRVVENGVDFSLWGNQFDTPKRATDVPNFVFLGRLVGWKAVELLLLAFRSAAAQAPMSLTIVGDGPERDRLEKTCRDWGMLTHDAPKDGEVQFTGWRSQTECAALLRRSSALVLTSLMECGGAVILEAMAANRPVIATDWGGPADYLDSSCGILVPPHDAASLAAGFTVAMVRLAQSPDLCEQMGQAGYRKAASLFDWEVKVDRVLDIYRDAIKVHASARPTQPARRSMP